MFIFFWKKILKKKFFFALKDYSPKKAGGNIILNIFIKNKYYLISVIFAYFISKKDTCKMKHQKFNLNQIEKKINNPKKGLPDEIFILLEGSHLILM